MASGYERSQRSDSDDHRNGYKKKRVDSSYGSIEIDVLQDRGVKDILIICADGLTGMKETIAIAFPKTEYQRCIVHQVRDTLKYVPDKDRKAFAMDLKTICQAADEKKALEALERVTEKWMPQYPDPMKRRKDNWDAISLFYDIKGRWPCAPYLHTDA